MSIRRCIETLACAALVATATNARAGGSEAQFKLHYERGLSFYSNEQYDDAIKEFQSAYDAVPRPRVLFNLGQAHRNLGNARQALDYYLLYQAREPNPKPGLKSELDAYIAQMRKLLAEADAANHREESSESPPSSGPEPPSRETARAPVAGAILEPYPSATADAPHARTPVYKRAWLWCLVGGVVTAAVITGVAVGVSSGSSSSSRGPVVRPFGLGVF